MNRQILKGNWMELKGDIRETWGKLTDDDMDVIAGKRDQLVEGAAGGVVVAGEVEAAEGVAAQEEFVA